MSCLIVRSLRSRWCKKRSSMYLLSISRFGSQPSRLSSFHWHSCRCILGSSQCSRVPLSLQTLLVRCLRKCTHRSQSCRACKLQWSVRSLFHRRPHHLLRRRVGRERLDYKRCSSQDLGWRWHKRSTHNRDTADWRPVRLDREVQSLPIGFLINY